MLVEAELQTCGADDLPIESLKHYIKKDFEKRLHSGDQKDPHFCFKAVKVWE